MAFEHLNPPSSEASVFKKHALQIVTACKAATFCSFTWKAAMATCCSAHRTPLEDYMVLLKRADPGDQS